MKILYASFFCFVTLGSSLGAQATSLNRFKDPEGITADPTGLLRDTSVKAFPRYPRDFAARKITGAVVVAFVIDTTGHVEFETASFLNTSRPEFAKAVCDLLPKLRFQPFLVGDQKWRVLLVEMFAFDTWAMSDTAGRRTASTLVAHSQEDFATKPIVKAVEQLVSFPHCDSPNIQ
jgi:Gram-negative bacterial TonB protein C-terminal